jgi:glucose-6-phosphate 1-dehydrogenase
VDLIFGFEVGQMTQSAVVDNPLLMGLPKDRAVDPFAMVILGAHGDLTKRKLLPALYALYIDGLLPRTFAVVGMSRTVIQDDAFRASMKEAIQKYSPDLKFEEETWNRFASCLYYRPSNFTEEGSFDELAKFLEELKDKHGTCGNHVFYMSTPPSLYEPIITQLAKSNLVSKKNVADKPWQRVIVEKPFGHDLASSLALDDHIHKVLSEHQVYRIDHYLGKETVQNIMVLRFANGIFEPLWNRQHVDHVQITIAETLGVEERGPYYEESGCLRDMIQNHMLQLVSLVAMEPPSSLEPEASRDEKAKVLKALRPILPEDVDRSAVRGQYAEGYINGAKVPGYRQEQRVAPDSATETYAALKLTVDNWRWAGVPFYVRSGKRLAKSLTEIAIHFKRAPHSLFYGLTGLKAGQKGDDDQLSPNVLVLKIQPDEGISLKFATKQPGATTQIRWLNMDFNYGTAFGVRSPSAYERLIHDCLLGDASLFARTDSVETSWRFIQPLLDNWDLAREKKGPQPRFPNYAAGSWGPAEADELIASTGHSWRRL